MKWHRRLANSLILLPFFHKFTVVHAYRISRLPDPPIIAISDSNLEHWNLTHQPNLTDTTHNFIFETANSLLQHWPNTRYRNGHTLVPATIPTGTLLYHGTIKAEIPKIPNWLAMDPEHSYFFCGGLPSPRTNSSNGETNNTEKEECWQLTFVTIRPLNLLYFDGSSAAKMPDGPLDSQDLLTWGRIREDMFRKERERIDKLCELAKNYNLDGFVRMEMDFEVMLCDFTVGLDPVASLHLYKPPTPWSPGAMITPRLIRMLEAGSWSNRFPGDHRIKVDYSRLISFYDINLFPNLHLQRLGQKRWDHRLKGINDAELKGLLSTLKDAFKEQDRESVIDWKALLHVVTNRYADRLELLHYLLENATTTSEADQEAALWKAHRFASNMLTPYILHDLVPPEDLNRNDHDWAAPVFKYCATTHFQYLETSLLTNLTASERLLLSAVQGVSKEICRVLVLIWAEGKELSTRSQGTEEPNLVAQSLDRRIHDYDDEPRRNLFMRWKLSVSDLMAWLDWSVWVRCRPDCSYNEMCYLPTWPLFRTRPDFPQHLVPTHVDGGDWKRPQPTCIPRLEPYFLSL